MNRPIRFAAVGFRRVLLPAALLAVLGSCETAGVVAPVDAPAPEAAPTQAGMTFELSPAPLQEGEAEDACSGPLSSRYVLADGKWSAETRWRAECVQEPEGGEIVIYASSGSYTLRGDTITFSLPSAEAAEFFDEESGILTPDSLTIWGHCEGETRYVRVRTHAGS